MLRHAWMALLVAGLARMACAEDLKVTGLKVLHHDGQTFITWKDVAEGEAGAAYRYNVYRANAPITQANLSQAALCHGAVLNHSGQQFGYAFRPADRLDPKRPMAVIEAGGTPLPPWSGLAVYNARKDEKAWYAVVATDLADKAVTQVVPGESATTDGVDEKAAPIKPLKLNDSKTYGQYAKMFFISGEKNLPLMLELHASTAQGGNGGGHGDYYLYYATPEMGVLDGMPGCFTVVETHQAKDNRLILRPRDIIVHPKGTQGVETFWFGYFCQPPGAAEARAYPYTERRLDWMLAFAVATYGADPNRIYCSGGSMGAWGSTSYAFHRPQVFAAVYPNRPRTIQKGLPSLAARGKDAKVPMDDGQTDYFERMNSVLFASTHREDLPFYGWCCGRRDGFASWQEQIDMVRALTKAHHGFAFSWNNGDHSSGVSAMGAVMKYYAPERFALNRSYPAFGHSSIDQNLGNGDPKDGDMEGGINLGFAWDGVTDEDAKWEAKLSNELAKAAMTVDVTPRRCQKFKLKPGETVAWKTSAGASGKVQADEFGLATVPQVKLEPGAPTVLTLSR